MSQLRCKERCVKTKKPTIKTAKKSTKSSKPPEVPSFTQVTDPAAIAHILGMFGASLSSKGIGIPVPLGTKWVELYTKPIPVNWGSTKLRGMLKELIGEEPKPGRVFLFFNKTKDKLKLYFRDGDGDQMMTKVLQKGGFLVPVADESEDFIKVPVKKLDALFRSC